NFPKCGNPANGHYCQGCALLRKKFKEDLFTCCIENGILQDSSEPSNDNTNVVNALQEPFVVKQDPGKNSSQSPPQINHHYCYGCGDSLEDIFCHQCTCELCEKSAHYGYNCPPKVLIIPNPEPFNNQTIDELPQTVPSFDLTCYSENGNSFTYDSTSNLVHDFLTFSTHLCNLLCIFVNFARTMLAMVTIVHLKFRLSIRNHVTIKTLISRKIFMIFNNNIFVVKITRALIKLTNEEEKQIEEEQVAKARYCKILVCYDDDDDEDYTIAVTPILSTKEPNNSLSMGDEHLDTILATESNEFIKSSVENLVPIPSESEGIPDNMCDVHFHDNSPPLDVSKDHFEDLSDSNDESTSIDDDSFSIDNIEYVEASPLDSELVNSEISSGSTTTRSNISLPKYEAFYNDHVKKISSDSNTTHSDSSLYDSFIFDLSINPFPHADRSDFYEFADKLAHIISPPEYDCFCFKNEPNSGDFTMDVVEDIFPTREPRVHNALPTHPNLQLNLDFILSSESLFAYVSSFPQLH
nr:hypothetical protein [Tanacetum cinerariifolium]